MQTSFIRELYESKQFSSSYVLKQMNAKDVTEFTFLYFCTLQILKYEFEWAPTIAKYAQKTNQHGGFDYMYYSGTDLYVLLHVLCGRYNNDARDLLKDKDSNELLFDKIKIDHNQIRKFLMNTARNKDERSFERRFLLRLESDLVIGNIAYKSIRRLAQDWPDLTYTQKTLCITRLLQVFRTRLSKSELRPYLENMAKKQNLELKDVCDPESGKNCNVERSSGMWKNAISFGVGAAIGSKMHKDKK